MEWYLFNITADPQERNNLIEDPAHQSDVIRLK